MRRESVVLRRCGVVYRVIYDFPQYTNFEWFLFSSTWNRDLKIADLGSKEMDLDDGRFNWFAFKVFPLSVIITKPTAFPQIDQELDWIGNNVTDLWSVRMNPDQMKVTYPNQREYEFTFINQNDALQFKLTFGGSTQFT